LYGKKCRAVKYAAKASRPERLTGVEYVVSEQPFDQRFRLNSVKQSLHKDAKERYVMRRRVVTILLILVGVAVTLTVAHRLVPTVLRSERHALLSGHVMLITMKKRKSSNLITFPVDYLREGDSVYVGCDSTWWKHLEGGAQVRLLIKGTEVVGWATPILDEPDRIEAGFKKLRPWTYRRALWTGAVFVEVQIQDGGG
jgi:hypothetical protein